MKGLAVLSTLMLATMASAKTLTVAVIDTGFDMTSKWENASKVGLAKPKICKFGNYDFVNKVDTTIDNHGHGTHIAGLIAKGNEMVDYCIVVLKYYDPKVPNTDNLKNSIAAYKRAINYGVDIINYSGGGTEFSKEECDLMKQALDKGIEVVAAAGNERSNLDLHPYYPALCDSRIKVVESHDSLGETLSSSNFSKEKYKTYTMLGEHLLSTLPNDSYGYMTGTSQATALLTGEILHQLSIKREFEKEAVWCSHDFVSQLACELEYKASRKMCTEFHYVDVRKYESRKRKEVKR